MGRRHGVGASVRPRCGGRMLRIWVRPRAFQGGGGPSPKAALRGRRITAPTQEGSPDAAAHPHPSRPVAVESREPFHRLVGRRCHRKGRGGGLGGGRADEGKGHRPRHPFYLGARSEEHTSALQSLMRRTYAVFFLNKKKHES